VHLSRSLGSKLIIYHNRGTVVENEWSLITTPTYTFMALHGGNLAFVVVGVVVGEG
jgi:hypothetical protein